MRIVAIAVGGAIGAILRYLVSGWAYSAIPFLDGFPWGTFVVNMLGAFLIGFLWQLLDYTTISPELRLLVFTGGLGAFTTFSTFEWESFNLLRDRDLGLALLNLFGQLALGLVFVYLGVVLGRLLTGATR